MQASSIYDYYVDISSKFKRKLSMQTGFISSNQPWTIEQKLDDIIFSDITTLESVSFDVYGAWDEIGWIKLNGIEFRLLHCNWWMPDPSWENIPPTIDENGLSINDFCRLGGGKIYVNGVHLARPYDYWDYSDKFTKSELQSVIQASSNNTISVVGGVRDLGSYGDYYNGECSGGANGYIDFVFNFKSKRH